MKGLNYLEETETRIGRVSEMDKKNYLIVGASSGIGKELIINLSNDENVSLIGCARRMSKLDEVQKLVKTDCIMMQCDVRDYNSVEALFERIRSENIKLDGLVYCAGISYVKPLKVMKAGELDEVFRTNVFGFYEMCRQFQSIKISNNGASIVGISSYAAFLQESGLSAYAMTKAAMNVQASVLSKEFTKRQIRINTVMPAIVESKMASEDNEWTEEQLDRVRERQAYGAIPISQVVECIKFLLSEKSSYITGSSIPIGAGYKGGT